MTQAVEGYGSFIQYSTDGGSTYSTALTEVTDIKGPGEKGKSINATHLLSPNGYEEFIPGLVDGGEVKLDLTFVKATYNAVRALVRTTPLWKITFSQGSTIVFSGFLTEIDNQIPKEDRIKADVTLKVTGKPTFTP